MTTVTINFTPPTHREDGTVLAAGEIVKYRLEQKPINDAQGVWSMWDDFAVGQPITFNMNPTDHIYQWRLTAYDNGGRMSQPSDPIQINYQAPPAGTAPPLPPTNLVASYS